MRNTAYLKTWLRARRGLKPHWIITAGVILTLLGVTLSLFIAGRNATGILILYSYLHGFIVSYFCSSFFKGNSVPMLPHRKSRGAFFCLMEWILNLIAISGIFGILSRIDPIQTDATFLELFQMFSSWGLGWIVYQILSRMGVWVVFVMLVMMYVPDSGNFKWLIWRICGLFSAVIMVTVNNGKLLESSKRQSSRLAKKRLPKSQLRFFNPYRTRVEFLKQPNWAIAGKIMIFDFFFTGLALTCGFLAYILIGAVIGNFGNDLSPQRIGSFFTLSFIMVMVKTTLSFSLENGLPLLPGMSRESWFKRNQYFKTINRSSTFLALIVTPLLLDILFNRFTGASYWITPEFRYFVMGILLGLPIILTVLAVLAANRNRDVFSGNFKLSLIERNRMKKGMPLSTVFSACFVAVFLIVAIIVAAANFRDLPEQLSKGSYVSYWLPPYLAVLAFAYWLERHWNQRAFREGDLV